MKSPVCRIPCLDVGFHERRIRNNRYFNYSRQRKIQSTSAFQGRNIFFYKSHSQVSFRNRWPYGQPKSVTLVVQPTHTETALLSVDWKNPYFWQGLNCLNWKLKIDDYPLFSYEAATMPPGKNKAHMFSETPCQVNGIAIPLHWEQLIISSRKEMAQDAGGVFQDSSGGQSNIDSEPNPHFL